MAYKLKIEGMEIKYETIKAKRRSFDGYCDSEGNELTKKRRKEKPENGVYGYYYKNKQGQPEYEGKVYKLDGDKPVRKFDKTKELNADDYKLVSETEASDLATKYYYKITQIPEALKKKIPEQKALKFRYSTGGGYKEYIGYIREYGKGYLLEIGRIFLSDAIEQADIQDAEIDLEEQEPEVEKAESQIEI